MTYPFANAKAAIAYVAASLMAFAGALLLDVWLFLVGLSIAILVFLASAPPTKRTGE
jgi:hypothetical protein